MRRPTGLNILPLRHANRLRGWLRHPAASFVLLGISFLGFGISTLSLAMLVKQNLELVAQYGWQAVMDGALWQLFGLAGTTYAGMACYVVFKVCEHRLVQAVDAPGH